MNKNPLLPRNITKKINKNEKAHLEYAQSKVDAALRVAVLFDKDAVVWRNFGDKLEQQKETDRGFRRKKMSFINWS